ncbi:glycine betaine/L-proline ABC transporter ATP-binding protein [Ammoniphilus sp. 3BR4]|uniref:quaternary amine ABC transporter ATP-binding protein n=1 Tax=Ammoniphilus sp. 3BR4 TaxID=3158265 RepID=UPI003466261E
MDKAVKAKFKVSNVTKVFGDRPEQAIRYLVEGKTKKEILEETGMTVGVNKANFEVGSGEIFVIMGLSGSGKSTLVRMLNRLIEPTEGEIQIDGIDIVKMNKEQLREVRRKKVGMVFQKFALFPHKKVLGNVEYGLKIQGVPSKERTEKALKSLELVGLTGYEQSFPDQLSGGMQQRVGLARALANDPDILLMDEAFSALDPLIRKEMQDELLRLQESMHKTIIFITHDLDEALRIGGRIALMKDGSIVQIGTPAEIILQPADDYVKRFVEDVDFSKVLKASNIQENRGAVAAEKGLRGALEKMTVEGAQFVYITNDRNELEGSVSFQEVSAAIKEGKSLADILIHDMTCVNEEMLLMDLLDQVASSERPVAVLDRKNQFTGIVTKERLLYAMSKNKSCINSDIQLGKKGEKTNNRITAKLTAVKKGVI